MLIIGRKRDQKIIISDEIVITVLEVGRNRVRFGIEAPKEVPIQTRLGAAEEGKAPEAKGKLKPHPFGVIAAESTRRNVKE